MPRTRATSAREPKCSMTSAVRMASLFGTPNVMSIGATNDCGRTLLGVPKPDLAERLKNVRDAAGYGGPRQASAFAREIGITPPALHDLESGRSRDVKKSLKGYIEIGANPDYILNGRGVPVFKDVEKRLRAQTLLSMMMDLDDEQQAAVEGVIKGFIRSNPENSANDPFRIDPPKPPKKR